MTVVELVWGSIGIPALGHDKDVWCAAEGIWEDGDWAKVNIRVVTRCLSGGGSIEVPFWKLLNSVNLALWWLGKSLQDVLSVHKVRQKGYDETMTK